MGRWRASATVVASLALVAACATSAPEEAVPLSACTPQVCDRQIGDVSVSIATPTEFNGTLVVYVPGYRAEQSEPEATDEPAPGSGGISALATEVSSELLARGYAVMQAQGAPGWSVAGINESLDDAVEHFRNNLGSPSRVIVSGDSMGGLVATLAAESSTEWADAGLALCAPVAGVLENFDLALDVMLGINVLLDQQLVLDDYQDVEQARLTASQAQGAVVRAGLGSGRAELAYLAAITDAPTKTRNQDGDTDFSQLLAIGEGLIGAIQFSTVARYDIEQQVGGPFSQSGREPFGERVTPDVQRRINAIAGDSRAFERFSRAMDAAGPVRADSQARNRATTLVGQPTGQLTSPLVTAHTADDSVAIVQNHSVYRDRVERAGALGRLTAVYSVPPQTYDEAPFGAGHCNFPVASRVALVELTEAVLDQGTPAAADTIETILPANEGWDGAFTPGPWPR